MENNDIADPDLKVVGTYLREQVGFCHALAKSVQETFFRETNRTAQDATLKLLTRLIDATATAAGAMNRIKGTQINQTITVLRAKKEGLEGTGVGASPENAKTNSAA